MNAGSIKDEITIDIYTDYELGNKELFDKHCKGNKYYPLILPARKKDEDIIVIGDIHGDFDLTLRVLKLAKVIDDNNKWIGKNTYVIQVGDQLDNCRPWIKKCDEPSHSASNPSRDEKDVESLSSYSGETPEDIKVMNFFTELNKEANKEGGAVISLLGNHEIMNVMGNMNYVSYKDIDKFKHVKGNEDMPFKKLKEARINAFKPGNEYAKLLACTRVPALIIGSYIFVHAGFINKFLNTLNITKDSHKNDLYKISYLMRKWLLGLINKDYVVDIINSKPYSMFWDRILGGIPINLNNDDERCVEHLNKVLEIFNVKSMIIGHTPQSFAHKDGINKTCGSSLWRVDFGGSFGFENFDTDHKLKDFRRAQVLRIRCDDCEPEILQ